MPAIGTNMLLANAALDFEEAGARAEDAGVTVLDGLAIVAWLNGVAEVSPRVSRGVCIVPVNGAALDRATWTIGGLGRDSEDTTWQNNGHAERLNEQRID